MSTAVKTRGSRAAKAPKQVVVTPDQPPKPAGGLKQPISLSRKPKPGLALNLGAEPRVHLLPPDVLARKRGRVIRRRLAAALVAVIVLVALGVASVMVLGLGAQAALLTQQNRSTDLLQQQQKYGQVLKVKADVNSIKSSQKLATAGEILWQPYITAIQNTLPAGASITAINEQVDTAFGAATTTATDTTSGHIGTILATVSMSQSTISGWLDRLTTLTGFVDATPGSITKTDGGKYTVVVTIHINDGALANRFAAKTK